MATDPITWPVAFTIVGGIAVAAITIAGYLNQSFRRDMPWKDPIAKMNATVIKLESQLSQALSKVDDVQRDLQDHESRNERDFDRILERLEKVTDLMIDMIRDESSNENISNDKKE